MDFGWEFHRGDLGQASAKSVDETYMSVKAGGAGGGAKPDFDDSAWRSVDLPHDWVVEGTFTPDANLSHGFLPAGVGWYRKTFALPAKDLGRRLRLEFDGVFRNCTVWLNGYFLGNHLSGYASFDYDITDAANYGGTNVLAVRVDASAFEGWWYEGAGIYRHVWLVKTDPLAVEHWGTFVSATPIGAGATADVSMRTSVANQYDRDMNCELVSTILDADGRTVASETMGMVISAGAFNEFSQEATLQAPHVWSVDTPYLYRLVSTVKTGKRVTDVYETTFGIRFIRFDAEQGFFLNDKPLKLKGTCNHQDHAGVGVAVPDRINEFRIERLKSMGCNAYRCAHNAPTPELLDACDRLGMLVMDENRLLGSSAEVLQQLESLILRDRNHPCVIMWSLANEEPVQGTDAGARTAATMTRLVKLHDPTRPVTNAMNGAWGSPMSKVLDVQGCNYFIAEYDNYHRQFPEHPMVGSETASTVSTRGIYANDAEKGYVSAYDVNCPPWGNVAEAAWRAVADRPFIAGTFVWTGFDYRGEPTPYAWPCINSHFGIIDVCGFPKDNFYYYKSWWSGETVLHILPHWNWPCRLGDSGREGREIDVWCHSNCDEVELRLNGASLGRKQMPRNGHLEWKVQYAPGKLEARGYRGGEQIATAEAATTGPAAAIRLEPDRIAINADGEDVSLVTVSVVDSEGRVVPVADNEIAFRLSGAGRIIGVGNGDPSSHEPDKATRRRAFCGLCLAIVQSKRGEPGEISLAAESPGLLPANITIQARECTLKPIVAAVVSPAEKK